MKTHDVTCAMSGGGGHELRGRHEEEGWWLLICGFEYVGLVRED